MGPPVIQDLGNMSHLLRLFHAAENKIIILGSFEFRPEPSCLFKDRTFYHEKMADIIIGTQKVEVKIRLQMRLKMFAKVSGYFILICIYGLQASVFVQRGRNLIKSVGRQQIVMVQNTDELSFRHLQRRVGIPGYP